MQAATQYSNGNGGASQWQPPDLDLVEIWADGVAWNLLDTDGFRVRGISAVVNVAGQVEFPHMHSDSGESLGDARADHYVRRRAHAELTRLRSYLRAAKGWSR